MEFFCDDGSSWLAYLLTYTTLVTLALIGTHQYKNKEISRLQTEVNIAK